MSLLYHLLVILLATEINAFTGTIRESRHIRNGAVMMRKDGSSCSTEMNAIDETSSSNLSRRSLFQISATTAATVLLSSSNAAFAAERQSLDSLLYTICRVREATAQEARLIRTGKFKDAQRNNVKLAIKFIVENYRLNDAFVTASAYLDTNERRVSAGAVGSSVVQNMYTILEYFDAESVQNIKVDEMKGKTEIVLKGLDASSRGIDEFLAYFPKSAVNNAQARIDEENALNMKEFDSNLGQILNVAPPPAPAAAPPVAPPVEPPVAATVTPAVAPVAPAIAPEVAI